MEENSSAAEERQTPLEEKIPENRGEEKEKLKRTMKKVPDRNIVQII